MDRQRKGEVITVEEELLKLLGKRCVTKMDIVKTEHDLICSAIECLEIDDISSKRAHYDEKYALGYIAGVNDMAKALEQILEEDERTDD